MDTIVNGKPDHEPYREDFDPPDRAIKLPNITFELSRTPDGGYKERGMVHANPPDGGSVGGGYLLADLAKRHPWITEQLWRRIVEVEDELRVLRNAISYKET